MRKTRHRRRQTGAAVLNRLKNLFTGKKQPKFSPGPGHTNYENLVIVNEQTSPVATNEQVSANIRDKIINKFYRLLQQGPALKTDYRNALAAGYNNPILDELSIDPTTSIQHSTPFIITNHIPMYTESYAAKLGQKINQGGFGSIFKHKTDPSRIIKRLMYDPTAGGTFDDFLKNSLRETFVQFYLSEKAFGIVPKIYSIAKQADLYEFFFVEMEFVSQPYVNLHSYFYENAYTITFEIFYSIVMIVCTALMNLEWAASFVHRDFKLDNIMYDPTTGNVKIIDFGLSYIKINPNYVIVNNTGLYRPYAPVRFQQDLGLFFIILRQFFIDSLEGPTIGDPRIGEFVNSIIPPSVTRIKRYVDAYNINGSKFAAANTEILNPKEVMKALNTFMTTGSIRGGRRKSRKLQRRRR